MKRYLANIEATNKKRNAKKRITHSNTGGTAATVIAYPSHGPGPLSHSNNVFRVGEGLQVKLETSSPTKASGIIGATINLKQWDDLIALSSVAYGIECYITICLLGA